MSPASEIPTDEGGGGRSGPTRPFIPGREAGPAPAHQPGSSLPRPFRTGGVASDMRAADQAERIYDVPAGPSNPGALPDGRIEQVAQAEPTADIRNERLAPDVDQEELAPEADFAPLVSWDPLSDVGWRAGPAEGEREGAPETPALLRTSDRAELKPDFDFIGQTAGSVKPAPEETRSGKDEFASKLEAIAAAIRRDKVEKLLAENPQDTLTALVAGYYIGTLGQRGGAESPL